MFWLLLSSAWGVSRLSLQTSQRPESWCCAKDWQGTQLGQLSDDEEGLSHTINVVLSNKSPGKGREDVWSYIVCLHMSLLTLLPFSPHAPGEGGLRGWVGTWLLARVSPPRMSGDRVWSTSPPCHSPLTLELAVISPNQHPQTSLLCEGCPYKHPCRREELALPKPPREGCTFIIDICLTRTINWGHFVTGPKWMFHEGLRWIEDQDKS